MDCSCLFNLFNLNFKLNCLTYEVNRLCKWSVTEFKKLSPRHTSGAQIHHQSLEWQPHACKLCRTVKNIYPDKLLKGDLKIGCNRFTSGHDF